MFLDEGQTQNYSYDANGNLQRAYLSSGVDRKLIDYDPYNKSTKIDDKVSGRVLQFSYGSNDQRFFQIKDGIEDFTVYIDKLFETYGNTNQNQDTGAKLYIGDYAVYDIELDAQSSSAQASLIYLYRDRLGSVVAMSDSVGQINNEAGRGFDAFGKPREDNWHNSDHDNQANEPGDLNRNDLTTRGFTGHEHLNETDLIHMNGRVYDYNMGRFLSVDPFIQFPENSQSMNAYSYLMNNPLSGTDPSGYQGSSDVDQSSTGTSTGGNSAMDQTKGSVLTVHTRGVTGSRTRSVITGATHTGADGSQTQYGVAGGSLVALNNGVSLSPTIGDNSKMDSMSEIGDQSDRSQTPQEALFGLPDLDPKNMVAQNNASSSGAPTVAGTATASISYGNNGILTDDQIANVAFNETASLSGNGIDDVRRSIIAAVINADERLGSKRLQVASTASHQITRQISVSEQVTLTQIRRFVSDLRVQRNQGLDIAAGAMFFNFRDLAKFPKGGLNALRNTLRFGTLSAIQTIGPLNNSYPTQHLGAVDIYFNLHQ